MSIQSLDKIAGTCFGDAHNGGNIDRINQTIAKTNTHASMIYSDLPYNQVTVDCGSYGVAIHTFPDNPSIGDLIGIGLDTYEFGGVGTNINVIIGLTPDATKGNLINKINTVGTESVLAVTDTGRFLLYNADSVGGSVIPGTQSIVLTQTYATATNTWNIENLNEVGTLPYNKKAVGQFVVTTFNVDKDILIELPFSATILKWTAYSSSGAIKTTTATVVISLGDILINADAGATPLSNTDYIIWEVFA